MDYNKVGSVLLAQGDLAGALKSYRDSLAIRERLARSPIPATPAGSAICRCHTTKSATCRWRKGDLAGALASYRDSLAIAERLAHADPGNAGWQRDLSVSYNKVGDVQAAQADLAGALASYRDGLAIRERLAQSDPSNAGWQRDLSVSYEKVGDVQVAQGDLAGALSPTATASPSESGWRKPIPATPAGSTTWQSATRILPACIVNRRIERKRWQRCDRERQSWTAWQSSHRTMPAGNAISPGLTNRSRR